MAAPESVQYPKTADELQKIHGVVPPPWFAYPGVHPYSICWRMGSGESYIVAFWTWWSSEKKKLTEDHRIEYFRRWPPPIMWLPHMIEAIWEFSPEDPEDIDAYGLYFRRTEALGFGSESDYKNALAEEEDEEVEDL